MKKMIYRLEFTQTYIQTKNYTFQFYEQKNTSKIL